MLAFFQFFLCFFEEPSIYFILHLAEKLKKYDLFMFGLAKTRSLFCAFCSITFRQKNDIFISILPVKEALFIEERKKTSRAQRQAPGCSVHYRHASAGNFDRPLADLLSGASRNCDGISELQSL